MLMLSLESLRDLAGSPHPLLFRSIRFAITGLASSGLLLLPLALPLDGRQCLRRRKRGPLLEALQLLLTELPVIRFGLASACLAPHIFIGRIVPGRGIVTPTAVPAAAAVIALTYVLQVRVIRLVSAVLCGQHLIGVHCRLVR